MDANQDYYTQQNFNHYRGQNKIFHDRTRSKQYLATNSALQKVLERNLQPKEVGYINKNTDNRENTQNNIMKNKNKYNRR